MKFEKLALHEGPPVRTRPWLNNNTIGAEEIAVVTTVLKSGNLSGFEGSYYPDPGFSFYGGEMVQKLEAKWSATFGGTHASSFNSATSAILASFAALGVGFGDEVIVPCSTMTACAPLPLYFGAIPIFADIDDNGAICPQSIRKFITKRTKCILVVHQYGHPANMDEIKNICANENIKLIEDCAQAYQAKYKGRPVGSYGDISLFSLNINKTIHAGEGGVCVTDSPEIHKKLCLFRNHGENVVKDIFPESPNISNMIGLNLRMTEVQAAIALKQIEKIDSLNRERMELVNFLVKEFHEISFARILVGHDENQSAFYQLPIWIERLPEHLDIDFIIKALRAEGIYVISAPSLLLRQPLYQFKSPFKYGYPFSAKENADIQTNYEERFFPNALKQEKNLILFEYARAPHTRTDMEDVVRAFKKIEANLF